MSNEYTGQYTHLENKQVRLTKGESVIVGTVTYVSRFYDSIDVEIEDFDTEVNIEPDNGVLIEVIVPPKPKAHEHPLGTVVTADDDNSDRLIKIAEDAWVLYGGVWRVDTVSTYNNQRVDEDGYTEVVVSE